MKNNINMKTIFFMDIGLNLYNEYKYINLLL